MEDGFEASTRRRERGVVVGEEGRVLEVVEGGGGVSTVGGVSTMGELPVRGFSTAGISAFLI